MQVEDVNLRVLRRGDGTLELADLLESKVERSTASFRQRPRAGRFVLEIRAGTVTLIDEASKTRLQLQNVEGEGVREGQRTVINQMRGTLNGGPFHFAGELDGSGDAPRFEGRFRADDVVLDDGMSMLRYAVPVLAGASLNLKGHLDSDLYLQGQGATWEDLRRTLAATG